MSRRDLFHVIGSAAAAAGAPGRRRPKHIPRPRAATQPEALPRRKVFDDHEWHTVGVLCDLIMPADERSGSATQAGVPEFIDDWLDFRKQEDGNDDFAAQILGGLAWLDQESQRLFGKPFAGARPASRSKFWTASPGPTAPPPKTVAGSPSSASSAI